MKKVGFVGWRGMVGSVLLDRMREENNFGQFEATFFSTSQAGQAAPLESSQKELADAYELNALSAMDVILTSQGGDYTNRVHPQLRQQGWNGFWIDAASALRMNSDSLIVLDPVNRDVINRGINNGIRDFIGGNCTVSLMLMGLQGLFRAGWVEWLSSMTYQSASGAGAENMIELVAQMGKLAEGQSPGQSALEIERAVRAQWTAADFPQSAFGAPLAGSLIPWIDRAMDNGQTREEWKGESETNKILQTDERIPVDGQCVRVGALRCHSQAIIVKLRRAIPVAELEQTIETANNWVEVIPNEREMTLAHLTPAAVSGTMRIPVGRIRKMTLGDEFLTCFTVGDQLLWGAAEPLRRMLQILLGNQ